MRNKVEDQLFAKVALENYFVEKKQISECLQYQQDLEKDEKEVLSLSQLLLNKGFLTAVQRDVVYRMMTTAYPDYQNKVLKSKTAIKTPKPLEEEAGSTYISKKVQITHKKIAPFKKRTLAGYELLEVLGQGAMGMVYKARQVSMDRFVALKVLSPELSQNEEFRQRFLREARATAKLNHNNIVAGIDVGEEKGEFYFVMEFVDGFSLLKRLERGGAEDEKQALHIVLQIARALEHAQKHKLVHRDIKPDNILMTRNGVAKLCDLGLALERGSGNNEEGKSIGTPNYISPEQALGEANIDIRSDIYSLGATFFHLVTGRPPFQGTAAVVMTKHINEDSPDVLALNPHLREGVGLIVDKMLEKAPENRYQNPTELIEDLERVIEGVAPKHAGAEEEEAPKIKEISATKGAKIPPSLGKSSKMSGRAKIRSAIRKRRSRF